MRPTRIAATLVALALAATACGRASTGAGASSPGETAGRARNATSAPLLPRDPAALPEFDLDRFHELLGELRGVPVVVNVWASWCGPCKLEAPHLAAAARRFGERIQFLGVDILDQRSSARAFIRSEGWDYPSLFDPAGAIRSGLGFVGQPDTVFFDRRGHRVGFSAGGTTYRAWQGPITGQALDSILTQLLSR